MLLWAGALTFCYWWLFHSKYDTANKAEYFLKLWHVDMHLTVLSKSFQMNTIKAGFRLCYQSCALNKCSLRNEINEWPFPPSNATTLLKPWHPGIHRIALYNEYQHDRVETIFNMLAVLCLSNEIVYIPERANEWPFPPATDTTLLRAVDFFTGSR